MLFSLAGTALAAEGETPPEARDLIILFTSDVHCGIDKGWGYAGLCAVKEKLSETYNVLLVDNGDAFQGGSIGLLSRGEAIIDIMNVTGYDAAVPGNHDFDYGVEQLLALAEKANFPYICCNFEREGEPVFDPWLIKEIGGHIGQGYEDMYAGGMNKMIERRSSELYEKTEKADDPAFQ